MLAHLKRLIVIFYTNNPYRWRGFSFYKPQLYIQYKTKHQATLNINIIYLYIAYNTLILKTSYLYYNLYIKDTSQLYAVSPTLCQNKNPSTLYHSKVLSCSSKKLTIIFSMEILKWILKLYHFGRTETYL